MTLAEVMLAMTILTITLISLGNFAGKFQHTASASALSARSLDLANDRLDTLKHKAVYTDLDTSAGTQTVTVDSVAYTRVTAILHMGGAVGFNYDYKVATVTVTPPGGVTPVKKSYSITAY